MFCLLSASVYLFKFPRVLKALHWLASELLGPSQGFSPSIQSLNGLEPKDLKEHLPQHFEPWGQQLRPCWLCHHKGLPMWCWPVTSLLSGGSPFVECPPPALGEVCLLPSLSAFRKILKTFLFVQAFEKCCSWQLLNHWLRECDCFQLFLKCF